MNKVNLFFLIFKDTPPLSAIVLAPARELAQQIRDEFDRFGKFMHFRA